MDYLRLLLLILLPLFGLNGCNKAPDQEETGKKSKPPPHLVEVVTVAKEQVRSSHERIGTLRSRRSVRIHNQEEGLITTLPFYEGDKVKQGDTLVQLDDALLRAQLARPVPAAARRGSI